MPQEDTQFKKNPAHTAMERKPICCKFPPEADAFLRAHPDRSGFIRDAVLQAIAAAKGV